MRCKCCNKMMNTRQKYAILDTQTLAEEMEDVEEDMCSNCVSVARDCYLGYNSDTLDFEAVVKEYFYHNEHDGVYEVIEDVLKHGHITSEEL